MQSMRSLFGRRATRVIAAAAVVTTLACSRAPTAPAGNPWRVLPGRVVTVRYAPFRDGRTVRVYLPPGYGLSGQRYPVLFVNDGEYAFDGPQGWHLNRACEDLIRRGEMEPIIAVAIETGGGWQRFADYTPWAYGWWCDCEGGGDFYLRAIRDTLLPELERRFRIDPDPKRTGMVGASLGGLISAYAAFAYDSTFGRCGAMSPTYGYGYGTESLSGVIQARGRPRNFTRWYQDTGWPDDNTIDGFVGVARSIGFRPGVDFLSVVQEGGEHQNGSWQHRVPMMLRFLYPPPRD